MKSISLYVKAFLITIALVSFALLYSQTFNPNLAVKLQDRLDSMFTSFPTTQGITVSVYCPGQGVWSGVAGESHAGVPITSDMKFGIASNSKLITSVMMLILAENNLLDLDDPISTWLSPYPNINMTATVRQLLNHTSGISDPFFTTALLDTIEAHTSHVYTPDEVLTWVTAPVGAPGSMYNYSNVNYILAGMIAEQITGQHISELIRDSILDPLNLSNTFYDVEESEILPIAHRWHSGGDYHDTSRVSLNTAGGAAGSIFATSADIVTWYNALMDGEVINQNLMNEMLTVPAPSTYGLGIQQFTFFTHPTWGHGGSTLGYKSRTIYDPCMEVSVCGIANSGMAPVDGITAMIFNVLVANLPMCPGNITGTASVCRGETSVTYSIPAVSNATSYVWTLPSGVVGVSNTNSITVDFSMGAVSGNISVVAVNNYGESAPVDFPVTVNMVATGVTANGDTSITVDVAADTYQWVDCDNNYSFIIGATNQTFEPIVQGNYAAIISAGSCVDTTACVPIQFTGVNEEGAESFSIFPNPNNGILNLSFQNLVPDEISVYNMLGEKVFSGSIITSQLDLSFLTSGVYTIQLKVKDKFINRKCIID